MTIPTTSQNAVACHRPEPFTIDIDERELTDLRDRLRRTRWPNALEDVGWDQGTDLTFMQRLVDYWANRYDWRAHERDLNKMNHYLVDIDGMPVHFIHQRGTGSDPLPVLLSHSCFSNFYEFHSMVHPLADPAHHGGSDGDSFDVVAWSLPGFGFSGKPKHIGWNTAKMAEIGHRLMTDVLGYDRYVAVGGSWGAQIATRLAFTRPDALRAILLTQASPPARPVAEPGLPPLSAAETAYAERSAAFRVNEVGYQAVLTTKPQSIAFGLSDSPAGQAAWVVEKLRTWSDCGGDLGSTFTIDEILTSLSITWHTQTIASGQRLYWEMTHGDWMAGPDERIGVPTAVLGLPGGIPNETAPPETIRRRYNLVRYRMSPSGGHFPALEVPHVLLAEMRTFFREFR